jgi:ribose transport system substrate-binding protein
LAGYAPCSGNSVIVDIGSVMRMGGLGMRIRLAGATLVGLVVLTACGGTSPSPTASAPLKIDFASADDALGVFKTVSDGMVAAAPTAGVTVRRYDNKLDGATALANADLMIQDHPDIIVDWNAVANVGNALGKKFNDAKIPCLAVNQPIAGCDHYNLSNMQAGVGAAGVIVPVAKTKGWTSADTTLLMVVQSSAGVEVNDGPRYFYITMASMMPGFPTETPDQLNPQTTVIGNHQAVQYEGNSTLDAAYAATKNILPTIPASNHIMVFGDDDDFALGAMQAITQAGRASTSYACGLGPTPAGLTHLRTDPSWLCEASTFTEDWPEFIIAEAVAIHMGIKPPPLTSSPQTTLTKDNVDTYYNSSNAIILLPPLAANAQYLKQTGILQKFHNVQGL